MADWLEAKKKKHFIAGCDVAVVEVFVLYALVKSVLEPALRYHHIHLCFNSNLRATMVSL